MPLKTNSRLDANHAPGNPVPIDNDPGEAYQHRQGKHKTPQLLWFDKNNPHWFHPASFLGLFLKINK
jgi:hypothetical protein